jgi:cytochrome c1
MCNRNKHADSSFAPSDTKEKPFICRCGAAFARRDLLTRHQRLTFHVGGSGASVTESEAASSPRGAAPDLEAAAAAAAAESLSSLSGLNAPPWDQQPGAASVPAYIDVHVTQRNLAPPGGVAQPYDQSLMAPQLFGQGKVPLRSTAMPN